MRDATRRRAATATATATATHETTQKKQSLGGEVGVWDRSQDGPGWKG